MARHVRLRERHVHEDNCIRPANRAITQVIPDSISVIDDNVHNTHGSVFLIRVISIP